MSVIIRKNVEAMASSEWNRFVAALNEFKASGAYDLITQHHATAMNKLTLFPGETGTSPTLRTADPLFSPGTVRRLGN